ncbi:uncharacterized protein [Oryza sativa Japonica Group]|uniref:Expressed protein n=2 Tax=Oryza sativa subsp. japonica TaxID=39947 RepID=Q10SM0_ORYSJ|nr:uncharacterized protein LOC4331413 [Oryza sativa Japonica Group]ABF93666.1 expressed protein [Oryza sativa Japonica Group]KAF2936952.1 hypothetical protein DAI22_03g015500 [Oryza sativa Japonica Group]BAF10684.1 Os03g0118100 [Oryza sativa Japonica Group]BAG92792.1 unnamed protein product [Oryza sativa Japonica Group]BAG97042.1 unnamed protein product [Oryza sativa Japonica Group]|eukprot:NP_001048770.1 Os03g0118100 [Oryza sativa Japonica Group]
MAVAAPARRLTPLTLRDFLEQSSSEGFRAYPRFPVADEGVAGGDLAPPVRLLIEAGLRRSPSRLPSFYNFFHKSPGTLAKISRLSRSLSRRFRDGLWRRRGEDDGEEDDDIAVDERDSLGLPSPVVSSCSSSECEYMAESEAELATTEEEKCASASSASEYEKTSQSSTGSVAFHGAADAGGDGHKEDVGDEPVGRKLEMEDKQQLSPVSVLDFPFDDDDGEEGSDAGMCSPSFQQCLAELQRSKAELLHKIRRLEGLTQVVVPVDLEAQFTESDSSERTHLNANSTSSSDDTATTAPTTPRQCTDDQDVVNHGEEEEEEHSLLARLLESVVVTDEVSEWLLLDFFAEGVDRLRSSASSCPLNDCEEAALLRAAGDWARGAGQRWGVGDVVFSGWAAVADMERSRRWMCVAEEERDVGAEVDGLVMDALVDELVADLALGGATTVGVEVCTCRR